MDKTSFSVNVSPKFGGLFAVASKDEGRFAMHGVLLETYGGKVTGSATDGKRLLRATWATGGEGEGRVVLPADILPALKAAAKAGPKYADKVARIEVTLDGTGRRIVRVLCPLAGLTFETREIDGTFPPLDTAIPKASEFGSQGQGLVGISAVSMGGLMDAMHSFMGRDSSLLRLTVQAKPGSPLRMDATYDGCDILGVVMPIPLPEQREAEEAEREAARKANEALSGSGAY